MTQADGSQPFSDDNEYEYTFVLDNASSTAPTTEVQLDNTAVKMLIDSGSSVNIIDRNTYQRLQCASQPGQLQPTNTKIFTYGAQSPLSVLGNFYARVESNGCNVIAKITVVDCDQAGCLLGKDTAVKLGLLHIRSSVNNIDVDNNVMGKIRSNFPDVFKGVGMLKNYQIKLHIDETVKPVIQTSRRIPFHLRAKADIALDELLEYDIIEKVEGPSSWITPVVIVPKSNDGVRLCLDMRRPNEAILRTRHPIPTVEETLLDLNGATVFSKIDLKWGYHQIELHMDSRDITTFQTHRGLYRFKRLIFGVCSASEEYQHAIAQVLQGCENAKNISDDIIVYGKTKEEHDRCLQAVLLRMKDNGLTVNGNKCLFGVPELTFLASKSVMWVSDLRKQKLKLCNTLNLPLLQEKYAAFWALPIMWPDSFPTLLQWLNHCDYLLVRTVSEFGVKHSNIHLLS